VATTEQRPGGGDGDPVVSAGAADPGRMTLIEHLIELRSRIIKAALAIAVGAVLGWFLYSYIFDFLIEPYQKLCESGSQQSVGDCRLLVTDPLEGFSVRLKVSGYSGVALAMPVLLWQVWRFISPGLYSHEKRYAVPFVASACALFAMGAAIAYWTLPKALQFLSSIGGDDLVTAFSPAKYFTLIVYMMLAFGVGFEFPIVLVFAQMAGIVTTRRLREWRRYAVVLIAVLVAVATPSADPISMLALTIPMCLFYEVAIIIGRVRDRRRRSTTATR
jgi:sec-independent protein translocase protein TatC